MFGRLILILAVMWRLCAPQQALAWTMEALPTTQTQTQIARADEEQTDLPAAWLDEQTEEEWDETEYDDADHADLGFGPALASSPYRLQWVAETCLSAESGTSAQAGTSIKARVALYVLHGQLLL